MTFSDLIASAFRLINVVASGEPVDADMQADSLNVLNDLLDTWSAERLMVFNVARQVFPLTAGKQTYQMGTGAADFDTPRPPRVVRAGIINLSNPAQPLELPIDYTTDETKWAAIPVKTIQSSLPRFCYDDNAFPFRNLSFWCVPNTPVQVALYTWTALAQVTDLFADVALPPAYRKALRYCLAVDLAAEYLDTPPPEYVVLSAINAKAVIKSLNSGPTELQCDIALVGKDGKAFNWITGE